MNAPFSQYDLNVALLSMDIYNGQFRPKVNVSGPGFQIGEFTLKKYSESVLANNVYYPTGETDPGMGFTAAYYESTSGKGIVSYRGTDFNTTSGSTWHQRWDAFITDAIAGYPAAISGNTPQGTAALNFFNEIKLEFNKPALEVTGQSLGGGLAGFVAMANDAKATIYENMPFLAAAMGYYYDNHTSITDSVSVRMGQAGAYVRSKIGLIESYAVDAGRESNGTGSESPEFLVNARALMDNRYLSHYGLKTTTGIINHSGITDGFEIHGQSLMILHMYGVNYTFSNGGNWQFASDMMMNRIYLNPIADGLGINDRDADNDGFKDYEGAGQSGDKMASIIAYTVMSTGARPFGDKAAHSLFDDMNDVGSLIAADQNWNALKTGSVIDHIGNVTAAFAGALALSRSTNSAHQSGVLKSDGTGVIYVDMNLARSVEGMARIHVFSDLQRPDLESVKLELFGSALPTVDREYFIKAGTTYTIAGQTGMNLVVVTNVNDTTVLQDSTRSTIVGSSVSDLIVGHDGHDMIKTGAGKDIVYGGLGDDNIDGGEGDDRLYGEGGSDVFTASSGTDVIDGGTGRDVLVMDDLTEVSVVDGIIHHHDGTIVINSIEVLFGSDQGDMLDYVFSGMQTINAGSGADHLLVGSASELNGQDGNDVFHVRGTGGSGVVNGGADYDVIDVSEATGTVTVDLQNAKIGIGTGYGTNVFSFSSIEAITYGGVRSIIHGADAPSRIVSGNGNSTVYGGNANDIITSAAAAAGTSMNIIYAQGGNDEITLNSAAYAYGGDGFDVIHGSSGNDVISGDADSDLLYGGAGDDEIAGGSQSDYIDGGADIDTAVYSFTSSKDGDGSELVAYSKSGNRIIVVTTHDGGRTLERDHLVNVEKIKFLDKTLDFTDPTTPPSFYNEAYKDVLGRGEILRPVGSHIGSGWESAPVPPIDPLVLDMDGDGVELLSVSESTSNFEFYVNGYAERSGWVKPDDAFLARDVNGNGRIDDITELFGNDTTSGFTALADLDSNGDSLIDVLDPEYTNMLVWNDLNGDGQSTPNELRTLQAAGIGSISTTSTSVGQVIAGNAVPNRGSYTMTDGTIRNVDEVHFTPNHQVTKDVAAGSWTPSHQSLELPSLAAFGYMQSLARAYDLKPGLVSKAKAMIDMAWDGRIEDMVAAMQPFVREWVDVSNVLGNAAQEGQKVISVLNAYRGQQYGLGASGLPTAAAGSGMESEYRQILHSSVAKFMIQIANDPSYAISTTTPANPMMQSLVGLEYSLKDDCIVGDVLTAATRLGAMIDGSNMNEVGTLLRAITQTFAKNDPMRQQIADAASGAVNGDIVTKALVEGYALTEMTEKSWSMYGDGFLYNGLDNLGFGKTTNAEITLSNGNDHLLSGPGNHRISLGTGNDVIMYRLGDGKDFVGFSNEFPTLAYQGAKRIVIDIDSTEVSVSESTDNVSMFLMFTDGGYLGLNSVFRYSVLPDITMEFADGAKWTVADLRMRGAATSGADTILGSVRNDYIDGLAGDDVINGGYGNDYITGGYGNDVLSGGHGRDSIVSNAAYLESWDPVTWAPDPNIWMQGSGTDLINGDEGDDTITLADPHSIVTGGAGTDMLVVVSPHSVTIDLRYGQHTVTNHVLGQSPIVQNISDFEAYLIDWGSNMSGTPNVFEGSSGADQLVINTDSDDVFRGHDGDDAVMTYGGDDIIDGGDGIDTLRLYGSGNSLTLTTDSSGTITVTSSDVPGSQRLISIERIETWDRTISIQSPIVLDMDHDGLALRPMSANPLFDMNGDGILDRTGWFRSGDGVLALDRNGDGLISKGSEISFIQDLPGARTDMEGLSAHDGNHDGLIDARDDIYSALRIWMDDGDGVSQASEMLDLATAGIQSIGLDTRGVEDRFSLGDNLVFGTGRFNHVGGGEGLLLDAGLSFQSSASTDMPNLRMPVSHAGMKGYGSIPVDQKMPIVADQPAEAASVYWNEDLDQPVLLQNAAMIMPFDMIM